MRVENNQTMIQVRSDDNLAHLLWNDTNIVMDEEGFVVLNVMVAIVAIFVVR